MNALPRRLHHAVARRLAQALADVPGQELVVARAVDVRLRDVPPLGRRPDIVVHHGGAPDGTALGARDCLLVVEIMSTESATADQIDRPAEYAAAGIPHFWRVENAGGDPVRLMVFRYRLDPATMTYSVVGVDTGKLAVTEPVVLTLDLADLV